MSGAVGTLRQIMQVFEENNVPVCYADRHRLHQPRRPRRELRPRQYSLTDALRRTVRPDHLVIIENIAIVAAVGRKMARRAGTSGKIFAALGEQGINIRMISQGRMS